MKVPQVNGDLVQGEQYVRNRRTMTQVPKAESLRAFDLFAGGGGSSYGAKLAGIQIVGAVDAWKLACDTFQDNNPLAQVYHSACEQLDPLLVHKDVGPIDILLASPECTNHTCAKGNGARSEESKNTAFQVIRFAKALKPRWIVIENVIQMRDWERYEEFIHGLEEENYCCHSYVFNAADFGVPQSRKRLFVVCELGNAPRRILAPSARKAIARNIIDTNGTYRYSPLRAPSRAAATLERAERAIAEIGKHMPFLLVYYGSDGAGGWQRVGAPLRTVTTLDRFAYVRSRNGQHEMRMLQVPELKGAMGFPQSYLLRHGTRRDRIKLLGNAVCPPVIKHILKSLIRKADISHAS